jgi:hypothetical protein
LLVKILLVYPQKAPLFFQLQPLFFYFLSMVSQAAARLPSPGARAMLYGSRLTMRPILKRPSPLPLSPAAGATASFSSLLSPSSRRAIKSPAPHVRFPSSPTKLVATINTYASDAYDRVPISVSPNPVSMPGWGERVYTPSTEGFRLSAAPKIFRSLSLPHQPSPILAEFEDPRSPRVPRPSAAADVTGANAANAIRFAKIAAATTPPARGKSLEKALTSYPRSPYPSAVLAMTHEGDAKMESKGEHHHLPATASHISEAAQPPFHNIRNKHGLTLDRPIASVPTTPHTSSLNRTHKPAPLALDSDSTTDSDKLSNAFWNSVSVEVESASDEQPMVTALEYPESAIEYEEKVDMMGLRSASQPPLMFAGADGVLFSPGLPKAPHLRVEKLRESMMMVMKSPSGKRSSFARKEVTAPSPNDPFAAFPSFGAVLGRVGGESPIQYPAPIALMA